MTGKLYYSDVYMKQFDAQVLSCEEDGQKWNIVLDRTAMYPEGGGQPADHGTLRLMGEDDHVNVLDVHEKNGVIVHTCDGPIERGRGVVGTIDWERRFDHMQQHSGEHIVSGLICSRFHGNNVGFHMSPDVVTIDFDVVMTWDDVMEIERAANSYIAEDHYLEILWPSAEELEKLEYRSKKELHGDVRIVSFPGADICACCGTHVESSAQVNLVKLLSCQKHKNGTRLEMMAGQRALKYLSAIWQQNLDISRQLSAKPLETAAAVERLKHELQKSQERASQLLEYEFDRIAEEKKNCGDTCIVYDELSPDETRKLCDKAVGTCGGLCIVFAGAGEHYNYAVIAGRPEAPGRAEQVRELVQDLNTALNGRGGGRDGWAQGSVSSDSEKIRSWWARRTAHNG